MKYSFKSDYSELVHPKVLEAFVAVGYKQFEGYGLDEFTLRAAQLVKEKIGGSHADIHFISGGTHANLIVISSILRPHEAVIAAESGHICVHEAGAIEATGHKICTIASEDGKLRAEEIEAVIYEHCDEHMVKPRMVYLSQSTETGQAYNSQELLDISRVCEGSGVYLFIDGARMSAALNSPACDLTYSDITALADVFYLGGTKNGALFGEAIVICNPKLKEDFRYFLKQRGALISKGAAISLQFEALLKDGLIDELAQHANAMASKMAKGILEAGYSLMYPAQTNMIFPTFPSHVADKLHQKYEFYDWKKTQDTTTARIVTSWATPESKVDEFLSCLKLCSVRR